MCAMDQKCRCTREASSLQTRLQPWHLCANDFARSLELWQRTLCLMGNDVSWSTVNQGRCCVGHPPGGCFSTHIKMEGCQHSPEH